MLPRTGWAGRGRGQGGARAGPPLSAITRDPDLRGGNGAKENTINNFGNSTSSTSVTLYVGINVESFTFKKLPKILEMYFAFQFHYTRLFPQSHVKNVT